MSRRSSYGRTHFECQFKRRRSGQIRKNWQKSWTQAMLGLRWRGSAPCFQNQSIARIPNPNSSKELNWGHENFFAFINCWQTTLLPNRFYPSLSCCSTIHSFGKNQEYKLKLVSSLKYKTHCEMSARTDPIVCTHGVHTLVSHLDTLKYIDKV